MPKKNSELEYLTPDQVESVAKRCKRHEDALLVRLVYDTGCRISEALALKVKDLHLDENWIELPALKRKDLTTKRVSISPEMAERLRKSCNGKASKKLFNISRQVAYYRIKVAAERAEIKGVFPHLLRDSLATNWASKGGSLTVLQRQLGHKRLSTTTDRYIRYAVSDLQKERERIGV